MKKLMIAAAMVCAAAFAQAAQVDWSVAGTQALNGQKVYLLTSYSETYASMAAFEAAAIDVGTIAKAGKAYGTGTKTTTNAGVTTSATYYFAMVDTTDSSLIRFYDASSGMQAKVYDTTQQESSKGTFTTNTGTILAATKTATIPEPTSGLLLILGMAGLALKRKRA